MALVLPRGSSSPSVHSGVEQTAPLRISKAASAEPSKRGSMTVQLIRPANACAIQIMRGSTSPEDRQSFILAYQQLMSRKRLVSLLCAQLSAPNPPREPLYLFARELLRHWRMQSISGTQLRSIIQAASSCFNGPDLMTLKLLALAAAAVAPPQPRASPSLGKLPPFGTTFVASYAKTAEELAEWSSLEEFTLFSCVRTRELVKQAWQCSDKEKRAPNISALVSHFNRLSLYIAAEILGARDGDKQLRVTRVHVAIGILRRALSLRAYNTAMAVFAGLNHGSVQRQKRLWMLVSSDNLKFFRDTEQLLSHVGNYSRLAQELSSIPPGSAVMPYLGAALKDLALIHLGNRNYLEKKQVNFEKLRLLSRRMIELLRYRAIPFTHPWPMSSSIWAQALSRPDLPSEEDLWHLSAMIEPKLYMPATDTAPARPFWQFSPDEVGAYLASAGLGAYSPFFQKHAIYGADALSLTDAELSLIGISDPISRTKVLTALSDVAYDPASTSLYSSSSSSSSSDLASMRSLSRSALHRTKTLRLKCECEGEIRVLRFEDGPPLLASYIARQAAAMFGINDPPTLDERHLRTLLRRNGKLELFRPRTPR